MFNIEELLGGSNATINILGGIGFFAVVAITFYIVWVYYKKIKGEKSEGQRAGYDWDGIDEYKNDVPTGWAVILVLLMVWAGWYYLIGYPVNSYSQIGEWNQENAEYKAQFEKTWENADDETLQAMGESVYLAKCAPCHGNTADGLDGKAADLTKRISAASVAHTIKNGSSNVLMAAEMPAGLMFDEKEIATVSAYVANGLKGAGAELYSANCAACHGADGKGMEYVAPSIASFNDSELISVIKNGKKGAIGHMPSFTKEGTMTELQYKAVAKYIHSLGQ